MFWQPNPAPVTLGGVAPPQPPDDWVKGFLTFYSLAQAPGGADGCVFNSEPATINQVVAAVNSQAALAGYGPRAGAKAIVQKIIGDAKADKEAQDNADQINQTIKKKGDLRLELGKLVSMDMRSLLNVLTKLKQAGTLEELLNHVTDVPNRVGAAVLTVQGDFGGQWRQVLSKLSKDDQEAILERTPADVMTKFGLDKKKPGADDDERPIVVGLDGAEVQAKLTFKSSQAGSLGETEFTIHIGADGKLSQFEIDMTLVKKKIENMSKLGPLLDLEAKLSLNATVDNQAVNMDPSSCRVILGAVDVRAKGEIQAQFKTISFLKKVAFKLSVSGGPGGFSAELSVEIPIPSL
jgi:hypothetical protein